MPPDDDRRRRRRRKLAGAAIAVLALAGTLAALIPALRTDPREAARRESHSRMLAALADIAKRTPDENWLLGEEEVRRLRALVADPARLPSPAAVCSAYYELGHAELRQGREDEAIRAFTQAYRQLPSLRGRINAEEYYNVIFYLGVACMRLGETQNCCKRNTPESCILPIRGGGVHTDTEGSRRAIGYFREVLATAPADSPLRLQARWLLNIAFMTLGEYPDGVPNDQLIPPRVFASEEPFPRFPNVAKELGIDTFSNAGGAIGDDFDGDGYIDLLVSSSNTRGQIRFFRNQRDGTFAERTEEAGLKGLLGGLNLVQADFNNDGQVDALVLRGGWMFEDGKHPRSLLRNNGDGTFTDIGFAAGLAQRSFPTQTGAWADFDGDGDLDLYIGNESTERVVAPCQLFRNNGDETFTDIAAEAGVTNDGFTKAVVCGDYDGDGRPDIYVGNLTGPNRLYHNEGNGTFVDVAPRLGVTAPFGTFPCWFWDFDNDGALDISAFAYGGDIADIAAGYLGLASASELPCLYRGDGKGGFTEVGKQLGLTRPQLPMGSNFGDVDGDGYLDFYLGTGDPDYMNLMPNIFYLNLRGEGFADVTTAGGFGHLQKGHAIVFADFDNDGDQDVFEEMGGAYPGDQYNAALYRNPGFGSRWIGVRLVGERSNRSAIGARIRVVVREGETSRSIYRHVSSGGSFGANPLRQHIGLGKAAAITEIEISWPTSGVVQTLRDVPIDGWIEVVEGNDRWRAIPLAKLQLAPAVP